MSRRELHIEVPDYAQSAMEALEHDGFESWLVGGCVRDAILKRPVSDYDLTTSACWEEAERTLSRVGFVVHRTGIKHGTVTAVLDGNPLEITTYRADGRYSDGRHPDDVTFVRRVEDDLARRDFTINALAYHPDRGLIDLWDGLGDLESSTLRTVGDPQRRFREDGLRILRGCRFASQLGFAIDPETLDAMKSSKRMLLGVSAERVTHELDALLVGEYVHDALMETVDVLCAVLPEITACKGFDQNTPYHIFDVWEHIAWVVQRAPATRLARWAALFHDIGKPEACFTEGDRCHFYGHAEMSAILAKGAMERLCMAPSFARKVLLLVRMHDDQIPATAPNVRRALARLGGDVELFRTLVGIKRSDALAQSSLGRSRVELADDLERVLEEVVAAEDAFTVKQLAIDGNDVMALGIPSGPKIGQMLGKALEAVIDGRVDNDRKALIALLEGGHFG